MDPEDRKLLERLLHITEQNNRILRRIRREMLLHRFIRVFYWLLILGLGVVGYYIIAPYVSQLMPR